jgi:hypothetical protein
MTLFKLFTFLFYERRDSIKYLASSSVFEKLFLNRSLVSIANVSNQVVIDWLLSLLCWLWHFSLKHFLLVVVAHATGTDFYELFKLVAANSLL